jgi:putative nucleotidyltransferase with HDIG domain
MAQEESRTLKKLGRKGLRRRGEEEPFDESSKLVGFSGYWEKWGRHLLQTVVFGVAIVFICFVGQEPPGLRALGEVAPENIYSDRAFSYVSDVRQAEAEEWIRSSTPREFARNFAGEENFSRALIRLREACSTIVGMEAEGVEMAQQSLLDEISVKYQLSLLPRELRAILFSFRLGKATFFEEGARLLAQLHLTGVVKFPSNDQKFLSEANATSKIERKMLEMTNRFILVDPEKDTHRFLLSPEELGADYPRFAERLSSLRESQNEANSSWAGQSISLGELTQMGDENASLAVLEFRNDLVSEYSSILRKGLFLRSIDREATQAAQNQAISMMDPIVVSVLEGDLILRKGLKVTAIDLEKYENYLDFALEDSQLLPKRIFVTIVTLLFGIVYVRLVLPNFWSDKARSAIVALSILINLGISRFVLELGETELFGSNPLLVGLLPYLLPIAFAPMIVMITVGPRMATLTAINTCVFHATMQNVGIEMLVGSLCSALVGAFFCRDVRLRGSVLRAGAMAGLTGGVVALGIGFASGSGWMVAGNHAIASFIVCVFTGALVLGAMPLIENVFKVATDATLFELTDFNHPLLRQMQVDAPGTYHHSLMVANLSENAALTVGANPILCRACALFHDIGKMAQPHYFTENQGDLGNPHNRQNPAMSALIIKSHVKEGIEIAREYRLPKIIRDVIRQHHGTTLVKYFYHQAKLKSKQTNLPYGELEADVPDESTYRYDGPKPRFKESAIIFFADSLEAAARSLPKVTHHSVEELLESIFQDRLEDGQLDECPLTLEEVATIKKSFLKTTLNMLHSRIEYPDEEKERNSRSPFDQDVSRS